MIAPKSAEKKPSIEKPSRNHATSPSIPALITSKKRPRVMTVIGSVRKITTGRTIAFANAQKEGGKEQGPLIVEMDPGNDRPSEPKPKGAHRDADEKAAHG